MNDSARIYRLTFASVYPLYIQKVLRKARTVSELDQVITWLTGYDAAAIHELGASDIDFEKFFNQAPRINPNVAKITGLICGIRVEDIEDKVVQNVRYLDMLVDELAKGKAMDKILRK